MSYDCLIDICYKGRSGCGWRSMTSYNAIDSPAIPPDLKRIQKWTRIRKQSPLRPHPSHDSPLQRHPAQPLPLLLKGIFSMATEHGINLGLFVATYKTGYKCLNQLLGTSSANHFVSGLIFGTLIFGKKSGVNTQIVLYLLSRVAIGLATLFYSYLCKIA